jgi:hypothetical protein
MTVAIGVTTICSILQAVPCSDWLQGPQEASSVFEHCAKHKNQFPLLISDKDTNKRLLVINKRQQSNFDPDFIFAKVK